MRQYSAERNLLVSKKGEDLRAELSIRIGLPYIVQKDSVDFKVDSDTAACKLEIIGLSEPFSEVTYGADFLQALQLAADVDPILRRLSKKYDFYFKTGEPYFE